MVFITEVSVHCHKHCQVNHYININIYSLILLLISGSNSSLSGYGESLTNINKDLANAVQDIGDRIIEVIGLENCMHMGQVKAGLRASGRRLAQCSSVVIR